MTDTIDRSTGLGGTDISAIVGLSPYKTPFDVWAEKTGQVSPKPPNKRMRFGKMLEQVIATMYCAEMEERDGQQWSVVWEDQPQRRLDRPWQIFTPDGVVALAKRVQYGIDCKNVSLDQFHQWGTAGTDEVPEHIACQFHWYMSATELPRWDAAVLLGGNDLKIYTVMHDPEIEAVLLEQGESWWKKHIIEGVQPEIGAGEGARRYLRERFPRNIADMRPATVEDQELVRQYAHASEVFSAAEAAKESTGNRLRLAIGEHDGIEGLATLKKDRDSMGTDFEALAWYLQEEDRVRLTREHQIVTREGPRKLRLIESRKRKSA